jgi:hypothetical protein
VPIYRKGPTYNPEIYRPISLTCIRHKLLEHIVFSSIMTHADTYLPFSTWVDSVDAVSKNLEDGRKIDILIMNFSKTFDKVRHSLPLHKLHYYETEGKVNSWIESRTQAMAT